MSIFNTFMRHIMHRRMKKIESYMRYPHDVQEGIFKYLIAKGKNTEFGREHNFSRIKDLQSFQKNVPVRSYEEIFPYIDKVIQGQQNVLWPSPIKWFAKSSGTTNAQSKFIPVSREALNDCHFKGGKDLLALYTHNNPDTTAFDGKNLAIGGSHQINQFNTKAKSYYGDVSAVIMKNLPFWAHRSRTPGLGIALMENWEEKIEKIANVTINDRVTSISGVPTWTVVLLERILEITGKDNIMDVWPHLEVFFHGAVSFTPYRPLFKSLIPSDKMHYMETYNATEGFFGIQDQADSDEMLLMLDYGIFYEFIPLDQIDNSNPDVISLQDVEVNKNYAMVISTNGGLWRYKIGDTIRFTSTNPFRFKISGRTKHFINAFGEELIIENAEEGIKAACDATGAIVEDFTAGPRYIGINNKGCHEWIIEFNREPDSIEKFVNTLDNKLKEVNTDYDAKRSNDIVVDKPIVHTVKEGTFYEWLKKNGKLGGQNKVPRLSNNRDILDELLNMTSPIASH